jgi:ABC-type dipeptide/oligopeptide/nickel transport system permease subunit
VRVILAAVAKTQRSEFILQARASGCRPAKIAFLHMTSAIRPIVASQFWVLIPLFLVAEANLGMLGLGVTEPLPSWGNLLAEMQSAPSLWDAPWLLAPAVLLVTVLLSLQAVARKESLS